MPSMADERRSSPLELAKRFVVGRRLASHKLEHQLLPKRLALPVFASDQLSSVAYATEEMMLVLILVGASALPLMAPLGIGIAVLLMIVIISYRQTVRAYPRGGGSYIVARENLGTLPGLIAAAAILTSYVLTVAVSVTAGSIAVTSAAPGLAEYKLPMAVGFVGLITVANLRGAKEAGRLFAIPTYSFVAMVGLMLATGFVQCLDGCPEAATASIPLEPAVPALTLFLTLRAFSSGATALTGVEAIADGVQAFRRPQSRNAAGTLAIMGSLSIPMFLGITVMARLLHVRVNEEIALSRSVLSQIGETVFGRGGLFIALQVVTAGILVLAANTAYQDFPRLSSILARDRFMPSQFKNRGDRLVFSNGIIALSLLAILMIWFFDAELTRLIQLYIIGVFTAITLSQAGMVRRWLRERGSGWQRGVVINGIGAVTTGVVLAIVTITKFRLGAWMVIAAMPVIITFFLLVARHYARVRDLLRRGGAESWRGAENTILLLIPDLGPATTDAVSYLRAIRPTRCAPLFVGPPSDFAHAASAWPSMAPRLGELEVLPDAEVSLARAVRRYVRQLDRLDGEFVTVLIPELLAGRSWLQFLVRKRRQALILKASLLFTADVVVTDVPLLPEERPAAESAAGHPLEPERNVVVVPVSAVHDATVRALRYARSLRPVELEGLFFVTDPEDIEPMIGDWHEFGLNVPLAMIEAPFRDVGPPLLAEIRRYTSRGDTVVTVVLPEFVVRRWWEQFLHNQTAFYIKRLLLFEPRVVVTSVPYHLAEARRS